MANINLLMHVHKLGNDKIQKIYRARNKGMQILLSNSQAEPGRKVKQEQEEVSRNYVPNFFSAL